MALKHTIHESWAALLPFLRRHPKPGSLNDQKAMPLLTMSLLTLNSGEDVQMELSQNGGPYWEVNCDTSGVGHLQLYGRSWNKLEMNWIGNKLERLGCSHFETSPIFHFGSRSLDYLRLPQLTGTAGDKQVKWWWKRGVMCQIVLRSGFIWIHPWKTSLWRGSCDDDLEILSYGFQFSPKAPKLDPAGINAEGNAPVPKRW